MLRTGAAQAFERRDGPALHAGGRDHAGARRDAVHQHQARAALAEPAAVLRAVEPEVVAQQREQRRAGCRRQPMGAAVDGQLDGGRDAHTGRAMSLDWMRFTPFAVICFQAAASEPLRSMPRAASSIT